MNQSHNAVPANVVYTDAEVLVSSQQTGEAIFINDGRVAAVGSNDEVLAAAGTGVERKSLDGAIVIPGLVDTHPHLMHFTAFRASSLDITDAKSHHDIVEAVRAAAAQTPKGEWIQTSPVGEPHYFLRRSAQDLIEGGLPDRNVLDRATSDHPVLIRAWAPRLPNVIALNSLALQVLGIDASTPDRVSDVWIEKDSDGNPTGIVHGSVTSYYNQDAFFNDLQTKMPPVILPERVFPAMIGAMAEYNAMGITTIYEGHAMDFPLIDAYRGLHAQGLLTLRVQTAPELEENAFPGSPLSIQAVRENLERALAIRTLEDDWLRIDGITATITGPCSAGFARWDSGYQDPFGRITKGQRKVDVEKTRLFYEFCAEHGLRLNVLSLTPDEHDENIELTKEMMAKYNLDRVPWVVQHGIFMREEQAKQFAELGFSMTASMSFTFGKGDMIAERMGEEALKLLNPLRHMLDSGAPLAGSMDWGPANPFEQMQLAVTHRISPSGRSNAGPGQVITRAEAFDMWTSGGSSVLGWEGIGRLTPGSHADLAIIDRNPITCSIDALPSTQVLRTIVGGRVVHDTL
ncbi:amidohydrolase family protein [Nocardia sp. R6R-6]|uniref:amidohydrolase family protein n=1 Tax=Nocardia sp. R6R-6 TaxID=3459303 RepID=UPI00403DC690